MSFDPYKPEPGRYENVHDAEYHEAWDAIGASSLKVMERSGIHYDYARRHQEFSKQTDALLRGSAMHCAILEPETFDDRYEIDPEPEDGGYPKGWRNTKAYREAKAAVIAAGATPIKPELRDHCMQARDKLYETPSDARDILMAKTGTEVSYCADDDKTGLLVKCRNDIEAPSIICDLKTTSNLDGFEREIPKYGYHISAAHYLAVTHDAGFDFDHYLFLALEPEPPFEFRLVQLDEGSMMFADRERDRLMSRVHEGVDTGVWHGMSRKLESVSLPEWMFSTEEQ